MSNITRAVLITVAVVGVLLLTLLVTRVGGIAIRNDFSGESLLPFDISTPIVQGAAVTIHWAVPVSQPNHRVSLSWRDDTGEHVLGETLLHEQQITVTFPCTDSAAQGTVLLRQQRTGQLIGQQPATLLPAGVECAFQSGGR